MSLSRSGHEINKIWEHQKKSIIEADERIRSLERRLIAEPGDEETRRSLIAAHRRSGEHDKADALQLGPPGKRFAKASAQAVAAEISGQGREEAESELSDARDAMHHHAAETLRARGFDLRDLPSASHRYRTIIAHAVKHLPQSKNTRKELSLLRHFHQGENRAGFANYHEQTRFHNDAARDAYLHSLLTRHPNINVLHGSTNDYRFVHIPINTETGKPFERAGGLVRNVDTREERDTESHLKEIRPHLP